ncbi:MAG: class I SAM-dependent methyltransferase [Candidatus Korobacteraceae bacterium]|jgi:2-polyprenyl-3-methyl-5-hydroxy-6-metoxy-1,4-benzoquinol methylase
MQEVEGAAQTNMVGDVIRWETVACDLCGASEAERFLDGTDWEFGLSAQLRLVQCSQCGLIYLNPRPAPSSIPLVYPPSYGFYQEPTGLTRLYRTAYFKIAAPYPYLEGMKPGRILDVGCATGNKNYPYGQNGSLRQLKQKGWDVSGAEPDECAAEIARSYGISIHTGRLSDIASFGERFDVVRFNHVLEHSVSPTEDLSIAAALLKENGRLIVSGPNIKSAAFSLFQKYWSGLDLPRHFYHFTPATLHRYCENAGLRIVGEYHDGTVIDFVHSLKHFLQSSEVSGRNLACGHTEGAGENAIAHLFSPLSGFCGYMAVRILVRFFNRVKLSDNYTVVAAP